MLCAGTASGELCGGFDRMLVYEITSYQGCQHEASDESIQQRSLPVFSSRDEQIIGKPWDFQEKYDTTKFSMSRQPGRAPFHDREFGSSCNM